MGLKKKVTTKDIADHVGLSQSAVSMILNNKTNVSFQTAPDRKFWMLKRTWISKEEKIMLNKLRTII